MRPQWWESLSEQDKSEMAKTASDQADIFSPVRHDYLTSGLKGISGWQFKQVIDNME